MLVCEFGPGESVSLVERTAEEVAEEEAGSGRPVVRVNPQTGNCLDPSGLMIFVSWLCVQNQDGRWAGPTWVYVWGYRSGNVMESARTPLADVAGALR